jgi:polyisoprenoid-binding protein YceI
MATRFSLAAPVLLGLMFTAPAAAQTTWNIDPSHSTAGFSVRHMMISNVKGSFGKMEGTLTWDGKDVKTVAAEATIDATTITTNNEKRDAHLKRPDFFDVEKFPTITFKSKRAEAGSNGQFRLIGDLTMRGVTKEVALDVSQPTPPQIIQGRLRSGATATTKLNRQDFGVSWNRNLDGGGILVGDEVSITLELEIMKAAAPGESR